MTVIRIDHDLKTAARSRATWLDWRLKFYSEQRNLVSPRSGETRSIVTSEHPCG